jgi:hypothetical protein
MIAECACAPERASAHRCGIKIVSGFEFELIR